MKEKILNFAEKIFLENGFYKTSMDEIASSMQMSKKTIYKFFPSKNNLVEMVILRIAKEMKENTERVVSSDANSVVKLHRHSTIIAERISKMNLKWLNEIQIHLPKVWNQVEIIRKGIIEKNMTKIITQGKKEGLIKDYPNEIILAIIIASIQSVVTPKFIIENNLSAQNAVITVLDLVFSGMLTNKGRKILKQINDGK